MKKIPLTQGEFALVDDEDFDWLNQWKWLLLTNGKNNLYAATWIGGKCVLMHRLILGLKKENKLQVDHINNNGLDNQKRNLRICTNQQNSWNQKKRKNKTSKYKGVSWSKLHKKWKVEIMINSKEKFLGLFSDPCKAAKAYNEAAKNLFGKFARLNNVA